LHACPRKFYLNKWRATQPGGAIQLQANIDFAFGHAVGAGVQNWLMTRNMNQALFACIMAWSAEFTASIDKKKKNLHSAMLAVEIFAQSFEPQSLDEWELLILPNGKPAIEVGFSFHCGNGFKHYGHMDIALRNKFSKKIRVIDCKTTGGDPEEANYANSTQALSYAVMLEACLPDELIDYEVGYLVFSSENREWHLLPFTKRVADQAEFVKDLLLTQDMIRTYNEIGFFPKRGNACFSYFRRCEYFGECDIVRSEQLPELAEEAEAEKPDYVIDLSVVIEQLRMRKQLAKENQE
jgi:hypothetical protein